MSVGLQRSFLLPRQENLWLAGGIGTWPEISNTKLVEWPRFTPLIAPGTDFRSAGRFTQVGKARISLHLKAVRGFLKSLVGGICGSPISNRR